MGWKEYYQICPESYYCRFGRGLLKRVLGESSRSPLAKKESLKLVLGGFSPHSATASAFVSDCFRLRPQKRDEIYLLDLNHQPLKAFRFPHLPEEKKLACLQADLAKMPFGNKSLDLIWLDGTSGFMNNEELASFGKEADRTLNKEGIVVSIFHEPLFSFLPSSRFSSDSFANQTRVYPRSAKGALSLLKDLKLVWHLESNNETALVLASRDSFYRSFSGLPYALETLSGNG